MTLQTIIFIGMQGAGKGTQAHLLEEYLKTTAGERSVFRFETGAGFRKLMEGNSYTAQLVKEGMKEGKLQPEFLSVWLWTNGFVEQFTGEEHIMIDGFPRSLFEAQMLHTALNFYKRLPATVIFLDINDIIAYERLLERGRHDDKPEVIKTRLQWYRERVTPIIDFYDWRDDYRLIRVHGERSIEEVHKEILEKLKRFNDASA